MFEIVGEVVEMGTNEAGTAGITIKTPDGEYIELRGLSIEDIKGLPNVMYKRARINISVA